MHVQERLFIGGEWVAPAGTDTIEVITPSTEEPFGRCPDGTTADIDRAVAAARTAFDAGPWPRMTPEERVEQLRPIVDFLMGKAEDIAQLVTSENGSPISFSRAGQGYAPAAILGYYCDLAAEYPWAETRTGMMGPNLVLREPVGVVGAIVPWNVPLFVSMSKLAPALVAGCTAILKPSPETPLDAEFLAEAVLAAGLPPGVVNIVPAGREVSEHLVRHPDVDKISFTGSGVAGKRIMSLCGEQLKRVTLELGGKSACILLEDAPFETAVADLMHSGLMNTGQACVAQTRIVAPRDRYQEFVDLLCDSVSKLTVGDPFDNATQVGPLVAQRQRDRVEGYIRSGQDEGAKIALGGGRPEGFDRGWYVEPTVFVDVDNGMKIARDEIFGPVLSVIPYDGGEDEAVAIANETTYGLSGSVWTEDPARGVEIAKRVRTGTFSVNGWRLDFTSPFGGFKESGVGREFGPEGLDPYVEMKTVSLPEGYEA